jgi:threonine aldolase
MIFTSDNWAGAHPAIAASLTAHSGGFAPAYGASDLDRKVEKRFNEVFGQEVAVSSSAPAPPPIRLRCRRSTFQAACHSATGKRTSSPMSAARRNSSATARRLVPVDGPEGKMDPATLEAEIARFPKGFVHAGQPMAITLTQATEAGTVYTPDENRAIAGIAKAHGLPLHMDGARFANALVALDLTPHR